MVDRAREDRGLSMEYIRNLQMTGEHCNVIGKLPEIIQKLKDYNMILSCGPDLIREAPLWTKDYGAQMADDFELPFQTWINSGVRLVGQHYGSGADNAGSSNFRPPFFMIWQAVTRRYDGKVWQPEERIERVHALKMYTSWASRVRAKTGQPGLSGGGEVCGSAGHRSGFLYYPGE